MRSLALIVFCILAAIVYGIAQREKHVAFLADGAAHLAAYGVGILGRVFIVAQTRRRRRKLVAS
jgi:hypothetical protein